MLKNFVTGLQFIFDKTAPIGDVRIFWLLIFLISLCITLSVLHFSFTDWQNDQVITNLKNKAKPVTELDFPAVTICGSGQHMGIVEKVMFNNF